MKALHFFCSCTLFTLFLFSCGPSAPKAPYTIEASGEDAVFHHNRFSIIFPGHTPASLTVLPSDDSTGYSVTTPESIYPFFQLFFKRSQQPESKWDDAVMQENVQQRETKGDYDIRFRQVEIGTIQAYETAYTNYLLNEVGQGLSDTVIQYTRELNFVHDSMVYWLEVTSENSEVPDALTERFFGSFTLKK